MRNFFLAITLSALLFHGCQHTPCGQEGEFLRPALVQDIYFDLQDDPDLVRQERWPDSWAHGREDREEIIREAISIWINRRGE